MFKLNLKAVILLLATQIRHGDAAYRSRQQVTIPFLGTCGSNIQGICAKGSECSGGTPGFCVPVEPQTNNTHNWAEVTGFGMPMYDPSVSLVEAEIDVFLACVDANFQGECMTGRTTCANTCVPLEAKFTNAISSISILNPKYGCNFWVSSSCNGDGINIDSDAIYNLAATNYNDRVAAFSCYCRSNPC